jgi:hypothetical protein
LGDNGARRFLKHHGGMGWGSSSGRRHTEVYEGVSGRPMEAGGSSAVLSCKVVVGEACTWGVRTVWATWAGCSGPA